MKKSLIALAVFGAFSGAALADGSNVQMYGIIDVGVTHFTGLDNGSGATTSSTGLSSGIDNGSRIGFKGSEDLGGGLSAIFQMETGFCAAGLNQDGATTATSASQGYCTGGPTTGFMTRQAWVGVKGNFGTLTGGRQYVPAFINEANADPFGYGMTGQAANLSLTLNGRSYFDLPFLRWNQSVEYVTPNLSGFTGKVMYSFAPYAGGTVPTASRDVSRAFALDGGYANGPLTVNLDYSQVKSVLLQSGTGVGDTKFWQATGTYDFGVAKLGAGYEHMTQDNVAGTAASWFIGVTVPVGPGAVLASYGQNKNTMLASSNATAKQYAIGYTYALSKRTTLFASYAHISNDTNTAFAVGDSTDGFSGVAGQSSTGVGLGIDVAF